MNIGFYYHAPVAVAAPEFAVERPVAMFISELAVQAGSVVAYLHQATDVANADVLGAGVRVVPLPAKRPGPVRMAYGWPDVRRIDPQRDRLDVMVIRAPTPLLPAIARRCRGTPLVGLLVGRYGSVSAHAYMHPVKRAALNAYNAIYNHRQALAVRGMDLCVISNDLAIGLTPRTLTRVFTSSMSEDELAARVCAGPSAECGGPLRLLFTGRIVAEKGLSEAVEAFGALIADGIDAEFDLVGPLDDRRFVATLRAQVERAGLSDRIRMPGAVGRVRLLEYYQNAHVYLSPTHGEGGVNRALHEAMAHGLAVVTSDIGPIAEWVVADRDAVLVAPRDATALTDGLRRVATDAALRMRLGAAAREFAGGRSNEASCALVLDVLRRAAR